MTTIYAAPPFNPHRPGRGKPAAWLTNSELEALARSACDKQQPEYLSNAELRRVSRYSRDWVEHIALATPHPSMQAWLMTQRASVRLELACNPHLHPEFLTRLLKDGDHDTSYYARRRLGWGRNQLAPETGVPPPYPQGHVSCSSQPVLIRGRALYPC